MLFARCDQEQFPFIFASLMDSCHLTRSGLAEHQQIFEGRVVLRADNAKDDFRFQTQGASTYQMAEEFRLKENGKA